MTLKEKQRMYERFRSKTESACYSVICETHDINNLHDNYIKNEIVPELWDLLNKKIRTLKK